jgi:hypothetical protein
MRTDHIQKLNAACGNLARLAEAVANEHRQQILNMEKIQRSAESAARRPLLSDERASASVDDAPAIQGLKDAFDAVMRGVEEGH